MELVGKCVGCGKNVYCRDGFLDGMVSDDKQLFCHRCFAEEQAKKSAGDRKEARE